MLSIELLRAPSWSLSIRISFFLPYLPTDRLLDEQVGVYRVALMAYMRGQEELLDGLMGYPCISRPDAL
jgi:hypothetical protein